MPLSSVKGGVEWSDYEHKSWGLSPGSNLSSSTSWQQDMCEFCHLCSLICERGTLIEPTSLGLLQGLNETSV